MADILEQAKKEITALIAKATGASVSAEDLVFPPDAKMGDLSFPCFKLAKEMKKSPNEIARVLCERIQQKIVTPHLSSPQRGEGWGEGVVAKIEPAGAYLNFFLNKEKFTAEFFEEFKGAASRGQTSAAGATRGLASSAAPLKKERIMIEFVSPNNNKPLHLGHLRNAFLGESVARLLESQGAKVIRACLFNDRGLAIAKSMVAYKLWGKNKTPEKSKIKGDKFVGDLYVEFEKKAKDDKKLLEEAEKIVVLWEKGDKATRALWQKLNNWALSGFKDTFKRLGVKFDISYFESALWQKGKKLVEQGVKKGIFKKDETGAVIADLSVDNLPSKVMLRADGTAIYSTSDLYLGQEKFSARGGSAFGGEKNKLTKAIWCVGSEQELYLKQLFAIYKIFGFSWAGHCEHLSYGLVFLPEGKMKSREGKVVEADDLLNELQQLVVKEIKARHKLGAAELKKRAEIIAQSALRFYLLSVTPKTIVHFNPKESISFTGHTGPYLLYTYARIASILRKSKINSSSLPLHKGRLGGVTGGAAKLQISDVEWNLIFKLVQFQDIMCQAAANYNPAILAQYLFDLAKIFSDFYETAPVLKAEPKQRASRLALISAVKNVMANGLELLTIEPVEEM